MKFESQPSAYELYQQQVQRESAQMLGLVACLLLALGFVALFACVFL